MSQVIEDILDRILQAEGGYVDHPSDKGGATMFGITETVARREGFAGHMQGLPEDLARSIYRRRYWEAPRFDEVAKRSESIAFELTDTGVNMGPSVPSTWLQRWLTAFNRQGRDYRDLAVDGALGPVTLNALDSFLRLRPANGERVLLTALNCSQGARYLELAEGREKNEDFLFGWVLNRVADQH